MDINKIQLALKLQKYKEKYSSIYTKQLNDELYIFKHPTVSDIEQFFSVLNVIDFSNEEAYVFIQYHCLLEPETSLEDIQIVPFLKELFVEIGEAIFNSYNIDYNKLDDVMDDIVKNKQHQPAYLYLVELFSNMGYDYHKMKDMNIEELQVFWHIYKSVIGQQDKGVTEEVYDKQEEDFFKYKELFENNKEDFLKKLQDAHLFQ